MLMRQLRPKSARTGRNRIGATTPLVENKNEVPARPLPYPPEDKERIVTPIMQCGREPIVFGPGRAVCETGMLRAPNGYLYSVISMLSAREAPGATLKTPGLSRKS